MRAHSPRATRLRASRLSIIAVAALLSPLAIGCASPGVPRPPSLHLPQVVDNLTAERIGDDVQLHWTTPSRTTDDLEVTGSLTAEICRETLPATPTGQPTSPSLANCVAIKRLIVHPGPAQAADLLTAPLTTGPPALLAYRIQIFNANGHSAGLSAKAFSAAGAAPPPVEHLRATPTRTGVQLEWQPQTPPFAVELDRLLAIESAPSNQAPKAASKPAAKKSLNLAPPTPTDVHLRVDNQPSDSGGPNAGGTGTDAGGTIDRSVLKAQTYRYTAQRVRKVSIAGHAVELRSVASPAVTIATRDTFPPASPSGLAAIPDGTGTSDRSPNRSIDLSWEPVRDTDLAGYLIYRQDVEPSGTPSGATTRLTPTPVAGPAFRDQTAVPGQRYAYRVTAIDTTGNESAPSADVQETLRFQ